VTYKIKMELGRYKNYPTCIACGCWHSQATVMCEGYDASLIDDDGDYDDCMIVVCGRCLKEGVDDNLRLQAEWLDRCAAYKRSLIGKLEVPTYAEWQAAEHAAKAKEAPVPTESASAALDELRALRARRARQRDPRDDAAAT
jgi:hypothetical protein